MNKYLVVVASTLALTSPLTHAQSAFLGTSAAVNLQFGNAAVDATSAAGLGLGKNSDAAQNLTLQIARGLPFGNGAVASFGATASVGDLKSGLVGAQQFKQTAGYSAYGELGLPLTADSLVYGKLSLNRMFGNLSGAGGPDASLAFNGRGYGGGYRYLLRNGLFVQGEAMVTDFGEVSTDAGIKLKPSATTFALGVGYKF